MPVLKRQGAPDLYYEFDDYTDPWRNAPCIVLQHGFGRSSGFWYRWPPYLARWFKVLRPDFRGFGRSAAPGVSNNLSFDMLYDDLEAMLDAVGVRSAHFCGESFGGIFGMLFAAQRPQRVRTLNLISARVFLNAESRSRYRFGHESWEAALKQLGAKGWAEAKNGSDRFAPDTDPGLKQWFADEQGKSDVAAMIAVQKLAETINTTDYLARIEAPVLTIYPSAGPITTPEQEALLHQHLRSLKLVHLPSRYHNLHITQAAACAQHVLHFAAQYEGMTCRET